MSHDLYRLHLLPAFVPRLATTLMILQNRVAFQAKKSLVLPRLKEAKQKNRTRRSLYDAKMKIHFIMRVSRQQP